MQEGFLFHELYEPESAVYVQQLQVRIHGPLDAGLLQEAWQRTLVRHAILRTSFSWKRRAKNLQIVHHKAELQIEQQDWRNLDSTEQSERIRQFLEADRRHPLDLEQAPLMRFALLRLSDQNWVLVWSFHHLLLDGWSMPVVMREVLAAYAAAENKSELRLPSIRPYRDYIAWLKKQDMSVAEAYWRRALGGFHSPNSLAGIQAASPVDAPRHGKISTPLEPALLERLQTRAKREQVTLNTLMHAAWAVVLSRYTGDNDIVFGATVSGRPPELAGVETMVGLFINTLPVRVQVDGEERVGDWLRRIQRHGIESRKYEFTPLAQIQNWSEIPRGVALFASLVVFENYPIDAIAEKASGPVSVTSVETTMETHYPVTLLVIPGAETVVHVCYDGTRFSNETASRLANHLITVLKGLATGSSEGVWQLPILAASERDQVLNGWNQTLSPYPDNCGIAALFQEQVALAPYSVALVCGDIHLSYAELNAKANQLAHYLLALGVASEDRVAVCLDRSPDMIISLLAILKTGAAYLPLDPSYPLQRLHWMLADAGASVLLTSAMLQSSFLDVPCSLLCLDREQQQIAAQPTGNLQSLVGPDHLAYVIYTSGSTGIPKGVGVTQSNVVRLVKNTDYAEFGPEEVFLQFAPLSFDAATFEIWGALLHGARLVLYAGEALEGLGEQVPFSWRHHALAYRRTVSSHGRGKPGRPAWSSPVTGRWRCIAARSGTESDPRASWLRADQRLRSYGRNHFHLLLPDTARISIGRQRAHWPAHRQHACLHSGRIRRAGAHRDCRRAVHWWSGGGAGLLEPGRTDGGEVRAGCFQPACRSTAVSYG